MILTWMAYAALCAALIALTAWSVDAVLGAMRRPRRIVWIAAMCASIVVPIALSLRSHTAPPPAQPIAAADIAPNQGEVAGPDASNRLDIVVLSIWALGSAAFALVLLIGHRRTTVALKTCRPATVAGSPAFISTDFGPAVVGVLRHHVVVPAWTLSLPDAEQRLVVAHELEHARSGDPFLALAGVCAVVAMPWNPALWWQLSRLRLAIELDCDARVIARKAGDAIAYSRLLVSVGERSLATRQPVLAMSRSRSALATRFDALLSRDALQPRRVLALSLLAAGTIASVAFVPSPNVAKVVDAFRPPQPPVVAPPVNRLTLVPPAPTSTLGSVIQRRPARASAKPRNAVLAVGDIGSLPVRAVPTTTRGPLDSVVVTKAALPPTVFRPGGVIMAGPGGGGGGGRGGFRATATAVPVGSDSIVTLRESRTGGRGGARIVPRPDTTTTRP